MHYRRNLHYRPCYNYHLNPPQMKVHLPDLRNLELLSVAQVLMSFSLTSLGPSWRVLRWLFLHLLEAVRRCSLCSLVLLLLKLLIQHYRFLGGFYFYHHQIYEDLSCIFL
ncbi:hypothetical protein AWRI1631_121880 [Saccharomyces cerevisiae AWRI1631]|uniref:L3157 protein n=2 Tax=Saccharomyces cerevisiae TaxID=4932 RepID=E9PAA5_YEASX|nr:hypothetical protein AWRI1631_121880 [Saccharomyces cerevisiae AWRI1631]CAA62657.1 L3157 [Saccharomyces cerevisiae]